MHYSAQNTLHVPKYTVYRRTPPPPRRAAPGDVELRPRVSTTGPQRIRRKGWAGTGARSSSP
eukprot:3334009-Prymnesium_polylepis.1